MTIHLPYGRTGKTVDFPKGRHITVLESELDGFQPGASEAALVQNALACPIGSARLEEVSKGKSKVVLIASDHTRPVPSKLIIPPMLAAIRKGNPGADITILIATGCHREPTMAELEAKFGANVAHSEHIVTHIATKDEDMVPMGVLPSGGAYLLNRLAAEADLLVSEGFIEPHFFAGFSGGRKSVLPGVAAAKTVYANHCASFIKNPCARAGILSGNPIHTDMLYAAKKAGLAFIVNVVINSKQQVIGAFAGDCDAAHLAGVDFLNGLCRTEAAPAGIVITTNNGYPLDQNIYQAVKGLSTAEAACQEGGVIIILAACEDGHGGDVFYNTFAANPSAGDILQKIEAVPSDETQPDQWQSQILARVLKKCRVILISECDDDMVRSMHMLPAKSMEQALALADEHLGHEADINLIPEGVSSIVSPSLSTPLPPESLP